MGKIPWRRAWQPTPVFLPGESHGQRSLVHRAAQSPTGLKRLSTHTLILHSHMGATNKGVTGNCYLSATRRDEENFCSKVPITSPTWESLLPITWHWPPILQSAALKFFSDKIWPHSHFLMSFSTFRWSQGITAISQGFPFSIVSTCKMVCTWGHPLSFWKIGSRFLFLSFFKARGKCG